MGFLNDLFSGGAGTLIDSVGKVLDNVITTKEEKQTLDNEIVKAEMQYNIDMKKLSNEEQQMVLSDVANARTMGATIQTSENATKLSKNVAAYLALGTVILAFILFYILIFSPDSISDKSKDVVLYILGILSAILVQIYSYYFGSSAGSAEKSKTLNTLQKN